MPDLHHVAGNDIAIFADTANVYDPTVLNQALRV